MGQHTATILIVEDDEVLRQSIARSLDKHGFRALEAGTAFDARRVLSTISDPVDMVIMDLVLPGLQGREAANLLLARAPNVRILFTSGYTSQESAGMEELPSGQSFIRKPFDILELIDAIQTALKGDD